MKNNVRSRKPVRGYVLVRYCECGHWTKSCRNDNSSQSEQKCKSGSDEQHLQTQRERKMLGLRSRIMRGRMDERGHPLDGFILFEMDITNAVTRESCDTKYLYGEGPKW